MTSFYFQLFATKIISLEKIGSTDVSVAIMEDDHKNMPFKNILDWEGIEFHTRGRSGRIYC